jgi:ribosomal protein S18 acetylase RimI-like enzyme
MILFKVRFKINLGGILVRIEQVNIRPMEEKDKEAIISLSSRYTEFELSSWRDRKAMEDAQKQASLEAVNNPESNIFVAEDSNGLFLGYIQLGEFTDSFTKTKQGFIDSIAVAKEAEGKGVGRSLMCFAEKWAKEQGYGTIVLYVFANNKKARSLYEKMNYTEETIKYVKILD